MIRKIPVKFADNLAPFCPQCGSAEYMHNEDGAENEYCGQCGCHLDWESLENIDTDEIINRSDISKPKAKDFNFCGSCLYFKATRTGSGGAQYGICEKPIHANKIHRVASQKACKKWTRRIFDLNEKINN